VKHWPISIIFGTQNQETIDVNTVVLAVSH